MEDRSHLVSLYHALDSRTDDYLSIRDERDDLNEDERCVINLIPTERGISPDCPIDLDLRALIREENRNLFRNVMPPRAGKPGTMNMGLGAL